MRPARCSLPANTGRPTPQPPRRRPGPSWGTTVTKDIASSQRPSHLGPGLRRGGARDAACAMLFVDIVPAARKGDGTTPAKAGAQLGDDGNEGQRIVTATFPPGPRPPPGRCKGCGLHDAICRYRTSCPQGDGTTPAKAGAQLGDGGNAEQRVLTATFPIGPRPSPGWSCVGVDPAIGTQANENAPPQQPRPPPPAPPPRQMQPQILPAPRRHAIAQA